MKVTSIEYGRRARLQILEVISGYISEYGWAPTLREIGDATGIASPSTVLKHLRVLEREGKLILGGGPRMIRLI